MTNEKLKEKHNNIKIRMDIVEVISHFVKLDKKGNNYVCKCLFHTESSASFTVNRLKGLFHCFGCGIGGDAIKFIQDYEKLDYLDAMKWLANFYNLPIEDNNSPQKTFTNFRPNVTEISEIFPPVCIPKEVFNQTLSHYQENNFVKFLHTLFEPFIVNMLIDKYYLGTSKYYVNGTVFWQVDETGNIRYGKIMGYNPFTGKRIKKFYKGQQFYQIRSVNSAILKKHEKAKTTPPDWVIKYDQQSPKPPCLFGLHLMNEETDKPIAIVESEKTAIVASVFMPSFIWMATGMKGIKKFKDNGELNTIPESFKDKFKPLAGRKVLLVPDMGAVEDWQYLASEISDIANFTVTDLINEMVTKYQLPDKSDLCDYFTSDAARNELIHEFKAEIIKRNTQTDSDHYGIWNEFSEIGLRRKDRQKTYKELITEGIFEVVTDQMM